MNAILKLILPPLILIMLGGSMCAWTWRSAGDPLVDVGRDPYAAQQMLAGRAIYADLDYLYGPFPPAVLCAEFYLFGESVAVIKSVNLLLVGVVVALLFSILHRISDKFSATLACGVFLMLFAFAHLTPLRNYTFLLPYTHAATHGFLLGLLGVWSLLRFADSKSRWNLLLAGSATGLAFLTKPEIFLACVFTLIMGVWVVIAVHKQRVRDAILAAIVAIIGLIAAPAVLLICLSLKTSWPILWAGTTAGYRLAMDSRIRSMPIFADGLLAGSVGESLLQAITWCALYAGALLIPLIIAFHTRSDHPDGTRTGVVLLLLIAFVTIVLPKPADYPALARGVPLAVMLLACVVFIQLFRRRDTRSAGRLVVAAFAIGMLARMGLNARIYQYGFVLLAPAGLLLIVAMVGWIPQRIERSGGCGRIFRLASIGMIAGVVLIHLQLTQANVHASTISLPGGLFSSEQRGGDKLAAAMNSLAKHAAPEDTLAIWVEGCWINFTSKRSNPTPYELLNPVGLLHAGGEEAVLRAYRENPPTWILLVHRNTPDLGVGAFGVGYAAELKDWLLRRYDLVELFGPHPFTSDEFGIAIYRAGSVDAPVGN